jgi:hypothetical protein
MEAVKASRGTIALTALAALIAAGMLWASVALAGGSGSSASPPSSSGSSPSAFTADRSIATSPEQQQLQGGSPGDCPNMGGGSGSQGSGSSSDSSL